MTVIDKSAEQTGTIINSRGSAIYITNDSELTLGINEEETMPNINSPKIQGLTYGVKEEISEGNNPIFNFYDGIIIGGTSATKVENVDDSPLLYTPTVSKNEETGNYESILQIITGREARIGNTAYLYIEDAIKVANDSIGDSNTQVEIVVLKDITKTSPIEFSSNKNIKLDLAGYTITTTSRDYVIKNYGKLEIIDSTTSVDEQTGEIVYGIGEITNSLKTTIYNGKLGSANGRLTLSSGSITGKETAIQNDADLYINGGKIAGDFINNDYLKVTSVISENSSCIINKGSEAEIDGGKIKQVSINGNVSIRGGNFEIISNYDNSSATIENLTTHNVQINNYGEVVIKNSSIGAIVNHGECDASNVNICNSVYVSSIKNILEYYTAVLNTGTFIGSNICIDSSNLKDGSNIRSDYKYGIINCSNITLNSSEIYSKNGIIGATYNKDISVKDIGNYEGIVTINGGKIESTNKAIASSNSVTIDGAELISTNDSSINSVNLLEIISGTIEGNTCGIIQADGTLTIGTDDGTINNNISIKGNTSAIQNGNAKTYYYDGILVGSENNVINGSFEKIANGCVISKEIKTDGLQYYQLQVQTEPVARIKTTDNPNLEGISEDYYEIDGEYYNIFDLTTAVEMCSTENLTTIELIANNIEIYNTIIIDEGQNITIKFNNKLLNFFSNLGFENNGILTSENDTQDVIANVNCKGNFVKNNESATLNINNLGISYTQADSNDSALGLIENNGILNIVNSKIENNVEGNYSIYNGETGVANIEETVFTGDNVVSIYNISNVTKDSNNQDICSLRIKGGEISRVNQNGVSTAEIEGCTLKDELLVNEGKSIINGQANLKKAAHVYKNAELIINSGIIQRVLISEFGGHVIINGGTVTSCGNAGGKVEIVGESAKINNIINSGEMIISAGTVTGSTTNKGTLTIGQKDGILKYTPIISGQREGYSGIPGIKNEENATLNFYDGIIEAEKGCAIVGNVTDVEEDFSIMTYEGEQVFNDGTEGGYTVKTGREIKVLEKVEIVSLASTGKTYSSFARALEDCDDEDTIIIIEEIEKLSETESIVIPEGKTITLDINGKNLYSANEKTFINNGTLIIKDSTQTIDSNGEIIAGTLKSGADSFIENNGTLKIESGILESGAVGTSSTHTKYINNTGTIIATGGIIKSRVNYDELIHSVSGTIELNDIKLNGDIIVEAGEVNLTSVAMNNIEVYEGSTATANSSTISNITNNGEFNVIGGTISYITNNGTGIINVINSTIEGQTNNYDEGIINVTNGTIMGQTKNSGTLNFKGESEQNKLAITSANALINSGSATLSGYVEINSTGKAINNTGTITIGDKENISNIVKITATDAIVNNNGVFNYYGGELKGSSAVNGIVNEIPEGYRIKRTVENTNEIYTLTEENDMVASNGTNEYTTLKDSFANTESGTIKLLQDIVIARGQEVEISTDKNLTLDLNGHVLQGLSNNSIINNIGTFEIIDSSEEKNGVLSKLSCISNTGTLTITGITINTSGVGIFNHSNGQVIINSGNFKAYEKFINNTDNGSVQINGGEFANTRTYIIYSTSTGNVNINGGNFQSTLSVYYEVKMIYIESSTLNISGGAITGKGSTSDANRSESIIVKKGKLNISGSSKIVTSRILYNSTSGLDISGGTLENVYITDQSWVSPSTAYEFVINITGGTITGTSRIEGKAITLNIYETASIDIDKYLMSDQYTCVINNVNIYGANINGGFGGIMGKFYMDGGSITADSNAIEIHQRANRMNIGITIKDGSITSNNEDAIYSTIQTEVIIGENTYGYPDNNNPSIYGKQYGINVKDASKVKFFDGIITGETKAINCIISDTPELFEAKISEDEKVATLQIKSDFQDIAEVNGFYFDTLQEAIDSAQSTNGTIILQNNVLLKNSVEIAEGSNIAIDLAGYSIYGYTETATIINNGKLVIKDSNSDGTDTNVCSQIRNDLGVLIENNGTLEIGVDDGTVNIVSPQILGLTTAIQNNGNIRLFDGQIGVYRTGTIISGTLNVETPSGYVAKIEDDKYVLSKE